jgi:hypothetical protein
LITAEEAQDYPDEAKPRPVAKPANPLDMVAKPEPVAIPIEITDPAIIEAALADTVEPDPVLDAIDDAIAFADKMVERFEVVDIPEVHETSSPDEPAVIGFALLVPGKEQPFSVHQSLDEWQDAYEDLADKTAKAGKRPPRERMTALKDLKQINEETIQRVDTIKRLRHTSSYQRRLNALGAAQ